MPLSRLSSWVTRLPLIHIYFWLHRLELLLWILFQILFGVIEFAIHLEVAIAFRNIILHVIDFDLDGSIRVIPELHHIGLLSRSRFRLLIEGEIILLWHLNVFICIFRGALAEDRHRFPSSRTCVETHLACAHRRLVSRSQIATVCFRL